MAITTQFATVQGIFLENAYVNASNMRINKSLVTVPGRDPFNQYTLQFQIAVYATILSYQSKKLPVATQEIACIYDFNCPVITAAYLHLKSLPEFADAVDC